MIEVASAYETAVETRHYLWCVPAEDYSTKEYYCIPQDGYGQNIEILSIFPSNASVIRDRYGNLILHAPNGKPFVGSESKVDCRLYVAKVREPPVRPPVFGDLGEAEQFYLKSSPLVECNDEGIKSLSRTITEGTENCFEGAVRIVSWVLSNIRFQWTGQEFATTKWILQHRIGTCGDLSRLSVGLMRAYGLPARTAVGTMVSFTEMVDHGWGEFYLPGIGWLPFEPDLGYVGWMDANHVKVASSPGDETSIEPWFKYSAALVRRKVEAPHLVKLKDAALRSASSGGAILCLTLHNTTDNHLSTRLIASMDEAVFMDGKVDALHDELLYLPPRETSEVRLDLGNANTGKVIIIINLFLGAYYKLELQGDKVNLDEVPEEEYTCTRTYETKHKPPWT